MKKILFLMFNLVAVSFADQDGVIEAIDESNKTITVNGTIIKVLPNTQIKKDSCWMPWDVSKRFADLRVGDIVELDLTHSGNFLTATKIEIQCVRNQAY